MSRVEVLLRPSEFGRYRRLVNGDGERVSVEAYVRGGVRCSFEAPDGTVRHGVLNGRRKYRLFAEES